MDFSFSAIFSGLLVSAIGAGLLMFGKKTSRMLYVGVGLAMCVYPFFITNPLVLWPLTVMLIVPLYTFRHSI